MQSKRSNERKDTQYFYTNSSHFTDYIQFLTNQSSSTKQPTITKYKQVLFNQGTLG